MRFRHFSEEQPQTIVITKETDDYRIVTDDPKNWHLVANRPIAKEEFVTPEGTTFHIDVSKTEFVEVILKETQEKRLVYTALSAVPSDPGCVQLALEIPWCFMNHSCEPNTHDRWSMGAPTKLKYAETEATRDIVQGEELAYDYALEQYSYTAPFACECGVDSCRGTVNGFKGLSHEMQKQLLLHASPYVQEKFRHDSIQK